MISSPLYPGGYLTGYRFREIKETIIPLKPEEEVVVAETCGESALHITLVKVPSQPRWPSTEGPKSKLCFYSSKICNTSQDWCIILLKNLASFVIDNSIIIYNSTDPLTVLIVCKLLPKILISYNPICFLFCFHNFVKLNIEIHTVLMSFSKMMFLRINESAIKTCSIFVILPGTAGLVFLRYHFRHPTVQEPSGLSILYQHNSKPWPGLQRTPSLEFNLHFKSFL